MAVHDEMKDSCYIDKIASNQLNSGVRAWGSSLCRGGGWFLVVPCPIVSDVMSFTRQGSPYSPLASHRQTNRSQGHEPRARASHFEAEDHDRVSAQDRLVPITMAYDGTLFEDCRRRKKSLSR